MSCYLLKLDFWHLVTAAPAASAAAPAVVVTLLLFSLVSCKQKNKARQRWAAAKRIYIHCSDYNVLSFFMICIELHTPFVSLQLSRSLSYSFPFSFFVAGQFGPNNNYLLQIKVSWTCFYSFMSNFNMPTLVVFAEWPIAPQPARIACHGDGAAHELVCHNWRRYTGR